MISLTSSMGMLTSCPHPWHPPVSDSLAVSSFHLAWALSLSRLREPFLPPPMLELKIGVLGTTAALTAAGRGISYAPSKGGMVKPDSQREELAPLVSSSKLLQQQPPGHSENGMQQAVPKDMGGLILRKAVKTLGHVAVTEPPGVVDLVGGCVL
ncbi:hypothetical protein H920_05245 [Fukomys damarensis]|uniref:Uncharacterized protein n=1 Tax=Fukomys damarensis TaxID=885580 RepID=A0A091DQJ5_FUKDA|nr:hypothetical protein H920_05245 [Fukomys damarensis]